MDTGNHWDAEYQRRCAELRIKVADMSDLPEITLVKEGEHKDILVDGRQFRICGPASIHPTGYVYFPEGDTVMDLNGAARNLFSKEPPSVRITV